MGMVDSGKLLLSRMPGDLKWNEDLPVKLAL